MSVSGTGGYNLTLEAFLGSVGFAPSSEDSVSHLIYNLADFPTKSDYMLTHGQPSPCVHTLLRPSITHYNRRRNINLLSIRLRNLASA